MKRFSMALLNSTIWWIIEEAFQTVEIAKIKTSEEIHVEDPKTATKSSTAIVVVCNVTPLGGVFVASVTVDYIAADCIHSFEILVIFMSIARWRSWCTFTLTVSSDSTQSWIVEAVILHFIPLNDLVWNLYVEIPNRKSVIMRKFNPRTCLTCWGS